MANQNTSALVLSSESSAQLANMEITDTNLPHHSSQLQNSLDGPVAILWDIENCPVPNDVRPEDVAGNIRMALRVHPVINGAVTLFSAYGDFNAFPRRLREGCQRTGVKLIDVPNGRKDAADKAILVDMFLFALDNRPPSSIMLISGDVDFSPALHILGQRGYTVILVLPSGVGVSSALSNAGRFVWDWLSVVRGEGFVPQAKSVIPPRGGSANMAGLLMGCQMSDNPDSQNEEEAIVYRGISRTCYNARWMARSLSEYNSASISVPYIPATLRSHSLPPGLNEASEQNNVMWVQPGDINSLKAQIVKLLELSGGFIPLTRVRAEYQKVFGRPLYVSEYGAGKLVNLFKKMADKISVEGEGNKKFVCLCGSGAAGPSEPTSDLSKNDKKGKATREENIDVVNAVGSSDELSDDDGDKITDHTLEQFKYELQEILVSYSCRIFVGCFEAIYQQRYKKPLDCQKFGVNKLEELFEKLKDIVVLLEEPISKKSFLAAAGG